NRFLLCNNTQIKSLGSKSMAELKGKSLYALSIVDDPAINEKIISKICDNNQRVMDQQQPVVFEEILDDKSFLSYKAPFYNDQGQVIGIIGISTNITENKSLQKKLEKTAHAADFYLESILMSCPSNIYWLDKEACAMGCNDQQARCVGLNSRHDII